jgi:hypothetical protein
MTVQISAHILLMKTEPLSETIPFGTLNLEMTLSTKLSAKSSVLQDFSAHPQFGRSDNSLNLLAKRANKWLSLLVLCQISFVGDSPNLLTGVILLMDMIK